MSSPMESAAQLAVSQAPGGVSELCTPPAGVAIAVRSPFASREIVLGSSGPDGAPLSLTTVHDVASVTKVIGTTTSLMRLVSENLLGLDDPVSRFLPIFKSQEKSDLTVRDLLMHRGGLWEWQPLYLTAVERGEALAHAASLPLRYHPDTGRHYSDLGFMFLGEVVSHVTGVPLALAVQELVTGPLGMATTAYGPATSVDVATSSHDDRVERTMVATGSPYPVLASAGGFTGWRDEPVRGTPNDGNAFHALNGVSGHAGLFSTLPDLMTYATVMAQIEEWGSLIRPGVAQEFFAAGPDDGQGLGFRRVPFDLDGEQVALVGHTGFTGCAVGFVPGCGIGIALLSNRLLTAGEPVPTDSLWKSVRGAASSELKECLR